MDDDALFDIEVRLLVEAVYLRYQHDFRDYSISSLRRRMRQALEHFGLARMVDLQHRLVREPALFERMLQFFTVQVSEMFRDPEYFKALRDKVMPVLATYPSLKIWIAGCSRGEEVWSMLILLGEAGLLERTIVYATDINTQALRAAESGVFERERLATFSRNYLAAGGRSSLSDYYVAAYDGVRFDPALRRRAVFADHSLATDAVFSEVHLVSCRNVLIYFNRPLQDRAIGLFRDSLVHRGFLGIGSRESLRFGSHAGAFEPVDEAQRIYQKK